jgi:hypothetical protein
VFWLGLAAEKGSEQEAADEAEVQQQAQQDQDSAVWRITDGKGASPEVAATTPTANRMAAGRLDFVLQVPPTVKIHSCLQFCTSARWQYSVDVWGATPICLRSPQRQVHCVNVRDSVGCKYCLMRVSFAHEYTKWGRKSGKDYKDHQRRGC